MVEPIVDPAASPNPADVKPDVKPEVKPEDSLISEAGKETSSVIDEAGKPNQEAQQAEEKRLLEADDATLSKEDKTKKADIVKTNEEKRLLEAKDEDLSAEDKVKKDVLVKAKEDAEKGKVVPEKYEFKVPEGQTLDQALVDKYTPKFKEANYTQEQAQAAVNMLAEIRADESLAQEQLIQKINKDAKEETVKALGPTYKAELAYVAKIRDNHFSAETNELLNVTGLANQKPLILDLIKLGKLLSEDKLVHGGSAPEGADASAADVMYPGQAKK